MQEDQSGAHGVRWGLGIGLLYCGLLALRFYLGSTYAGLYIVFTTIGFLGIVVLLFFCGKTFRKRMGGYVEMKELFKTMFISVLIFEAFFSAFSIIYLKYIDPGFFTRFRSSTEQILQLANQPESSVDMALKAIDTWTTQTKNLNVFDILKTYLYNVAMVGLFALLFAFILKRKPPTAQTYPQA